MSVRVIKETMHNESVRYRVEHAAGRQFFFFTRWRHVYSAVHGHYFKTESDALESGWYAYARWQADNVKHSRVLS